MSKLPAGWVMSSLGDLAVYVTSGSRDWSQFYSAEGALFVRTQDINQNRLTDDLGNIARVSLPASIEGKRTLIKQHDLLITITGANVGKCACVTSELPESYVSQSVALVRLQDASLAPFIHKQLITKVTGLDGTHLEQRAYGLGRPVLNLDNVRETPVALPPLKEQDRIVGKLDQLSARSSRARDELDRIPKLVEHCRQAVLTKAFSGELTAAWREQRKAENPVVPCTTKHSKADKNFTFQPPNDIPSTWQWLPLCELGTLDRGRSRHRPRNDARLFGGPYPFIQTGEVRAADRYLQNYTQTYSEFGLKQSRLWPAGTVCITIAANIAETAILAIDACFPDSVVGFTADTTCTLPEYIEFFLRTVRADLEQFAPATAQKNINLETLYRVHAPVPSVDEQLEIVRRIEIAFASLNRISVEHSRANLLLPKLDQAILAKAFRGELVPQDPRDEPASKLLERLPTKQATASKRGPGRKRAKTATS